MAGLERPEGKEGLQAEAVGPVGSGVKKSVMDELEWPKPRNKTEEYRQEFTKKIIGMMEAGEAFWQKPWKVPEMGLPVNGTSGKRYNGVNIAYLMVASMAKGYTDPRWMTYKQATEKGYQVRRGEAGTKIEYYGEYEPSKTKQGALSLEESIRTMRAEGASHDAIDKFTKEQMDEKVLYVKTYTVFNAAQIDGIEPLQVDGPQTGPFRHHERAEAIMENCGVPIRYGSRGASYSPARDVINMPNREWFSTPEHFYATALHEIAHSTGHFSRMNREDLSNPFGSPAYAMEELRAEMASAFVFQEIGMPLSSEDMEGYAQDHAAYTQHWLGKLQDDYREFYKAVRDATKIADYTLAYEHTRAQENRVERERTDAIDPVRAAKAILGENAIVTAAQKGRSYTGEIVKVGASFAIQRTGESRAIVHNLSKIDDPVAVGEVLSRLMQQDVTLKQIFISYDTEGKGAVKTERNGEAHELEISR